jgi:hypothetical protein
MSAPLTTDPESPLLYQRELEHANAFWDGTVDLLLGGGEMPRDELNRLDRLSLNASKAAIGRKLTPRK